MDIKVKKNLVLTGMMGVGKSTVGKILSKKLGFNFIDIDKIIEKKEKNSINSIFKIKGETYFRKLETEITLRKLKEDNAVISLGGGAFLDKIIRKNVKISAISFWLDVNTQELVRRLKNSKRRPLLHNKNLTKTINEIYLKRKKTYIMADFRIKCSFLKTEKIIDTILELYEKSRN